MHKKRRENVEWRGWKKIRILKKKEEGYMKKQYEKQL